MTPDNAEPIFEEPKLVGPAAAVELIPLPKVEPPSSNVGAAAEPVGAPSFQEHLERVGRRSKDDSASLRDDRPAATTSDAVKPTEGRPEKDAPDESTDEAKAVDRPPTTDEQPADEQAVDEVEVAEEATGEAIGAAAVAQIVLVASDEPTAIETESTTVPETPIAEAAPKSKPGTKTATTDGVPAPAASATKAVEQPAATTTKTDVETPVIDDRGQADVVVEAKSDVVAKSDVAQATVNDAPPKSAREPVAEHAPKSETPTTPQVTGAAEQTGPPNDEGSRKRSPEGPVEKRESAPTTSTNTATDGTTAISVETTSVNQSDAPPSDVAPRKRDDSTDRVGSTGDGDSSRTRTDRPHANDGPRPTTNHTAAASHADGRESNVPLSQADRVRLVQRVVRAVQTAQERGGDLKLRLSPPELGSLRLQVRLNDGVLTARIEAETPAARQALTDGLPALRERLAEQNIRVERFDVDLFHSGGGASQLPERQYDQGSDGLRQAAIDRDARARSAAEADAETTRSPASIVADGRLNVIV